MDIGEKLVNSGWSPALKDEITKYLPLHNPEIGWIKAYYINGEQKEIDLTTVFKDAHLIKEIELDESVSTVSLLRVLISIAYDAYQEDYSSPREWMKFKSDAIQKNSGFAPDWVDSYFEKWEDRFYLIHPNTPFLQDPSLYDSYRPGGVNPETSIETRRKDLTKILKGISNLYPNAPSTANEEGQKIAWNLPREEVYTEVLPLSVRTRILATSILHHRYNHSFTLRGARAFYDKKMNNDTHHAVHAFRCAVYYVPYGYSLFQTILLAMKFNAEENHALDIPEWERSTDPKTGFLDKMGYNINYYDTVLDLDAPRSSVNMTHLSLLFVPELDPVTGSVKANGGMLKQMRRLLFNFKHLKTEKGDKLSFPITWNPFIAVKAKDGRVLKQTQGLSPLTSMGQTTLYEIPLLPEIADIQRPEALANLNSPTLQAGLSLSERRVKVYVYAGDAGQDKTFANFSFVENDLSLLTQDFASREKVENWFAIGNDAFFLLRNRLKDFTNQETNEGVSTLFWTSYSQLFNANVNSTNISSVSSVGDEIIDLTVSIFDTYASPYIQVNPLSYAGQKSLLRNSLKKKLEGK